MMIATVIDYEDDDEHDENKDENDNDDNDIDDDWSNGIIIKSSAIINHYIINSADQIKVSRIFCHQVSETKVNAKAFAAQGSQWVQYKRTTQKLWWSMVWQSVQANMPNNRIQIQGFPGHKATNFEYQSSNQKKPEKRHASSCSATLLNINIAILITKNAKHFCSNNQFWCFCERPSHPNTPVVTGPAQWRPLGWWCSPHLLPRQQQEPRQLPN